MREVARLGGLSCRVISADGLAAAGEGPCVVLLHGFGAPGADLVPLADVFDAPENTRFVFPEAPILLPWGGDSRAWWLIDVARLEQAMLTGNAREMAAEVPDGLAEARGLVEGLLDDIESRLGCPRERVVLGGFSQGAMLACDVTLRGSRSPAGLVLMSSTLLAEAEWVPLMPSRAGLRVVQSHGTRDPLLPFAAAERLRDHLVAAGLRVTFVPFRGMHEIPGVVVQAVSSFLPEILG